MGFLFPLESTAKCSKPFAFEILSRVRSYSVAIDCLSRRGTSSLPGASRDGGPLVLPSSEFLTSLPFPLSGYLRGTLEPWVSAELLLSTSLCFFKVSCLSVTVLITLSVRRGSLVERASVSADLNEKNRSKA